MMTITVEVSGIVSVPSALGMWKQPYRARIDAKQRGFEDQAIVAFEFKHD